MSAVEPGPGSIALDRVTSRLLGWLTLLTAPAWVHGAATQAPDMAPWWNAVFLTLVALSAIAVVVDGLRGSSHRWPAVSLAVTFAAALALWSTGVRDVSQTDTRLPWLWLLMPLALSAVATFGSLLVSGAYGVAVGGDYAVVRLSETGGTGEGPVVMLEWGLLAVIAVGLALLVKSARAAAGRLDADAHQAVLARAEAARLVAAAEARAEIDAVLHDRVLAALVLVVRSPGAADVARLAREALAAFEGATAGRAAQRQVGFDELTERLENGVRLLAPNALITVGTGPEVPEAVARAVVEATAEAVRNTVRHARRDGGPARVSVDIGRMPDEADAGALRVTVTDNGQGFDPLLVPPERLGLAVSVIGRVRSAGGSATVKSAASESTTVESATAGGTTVTLLWPARDRVGAS